MKIRRRRTLTPEFGHWLAGFIDGEGCFSIAKHKNMCFTPRFSISLRDDDAVILHEIRERINLGIVTKKRRRHLNANAHDQIEWVIRTKSDCLCFVKILDQYPLRAKKKKDYLIWRKAILEWATVRNGEHRRIKHEWIRHDWSKMEQFKRQLEEGRRYR